MAISEERKQVRKTVKALARIGSSRKRGGQSWGKSGSLTRKLPEQLEKFKWNKGNVPKSPGRPKGVSLTTILNDELKMAVDAKGVPVRTLLMRVLILHALCGDQMAMREILDRTDGKVAQPIAVTADITVRPVNYAQVPEIPEEEVIDVDTSGNADEE